MTENAVDEPSVEVDDRVNMNQIQLNDVVKRERERAAKQASEKVRAELQAEYAKKLEEATSQASRAPTLDTESLYNDFSKRMNADMERRYKEEQSRARAKQVADMYHDKVKKGAEYYDDFNEMIADFDPEAFPEIAVLASEHDNTHEIIRELVNNPGKMASISLLAEKPGGANLARKAMRQLSESISSNQEAMQRRSPNAPLSKVKSSAMGGVDAAPNSISDLRKMSYLKG